MRWGQEPTRIDFNAHDHPLAIHFQASNECLLQEVVLYCNSPDTFTHALSATGTLGFPATAIPRRSINNGVPLKIMPLGASIVWGQGSTDGNGFRLDLRSLLEAGGNNVSYVGTAFHGNMTNNACEAYPGRTTDEVNQAALQSDSYDFIPNVILVHLGTNDCMAVANETATEAAKHFGDLLSTIRQHDTEVLVVASTLIRNYVRSVDECITAFNSRLPSVVQQARAARQKVTLVDMHHVVPIKDINTTDATHPTDAGYAIMAQVWYEGLMNASAMISPPNATGKAVPVSAASLMHITEALILLGAGLLTLALLT